MHKVHQLRILVTDVNHNVRDYLKRELEREGYAVASVDDRMSLLDHLNRKGKYDVIILDPELLESSDWEVSEIITQSDPGAQIIIHAYDEDLEYFADRENIQTVAKSASSIRRIKKTIRVFLQDQRF